MNELQAFAVAVLTSAAPADKIRTTRKMAEAWRNGLALLGTGGLAVPDRPARAEVPVLLPPKFMPKRTYGGIAGRVALIHALAHIELNAIDLACDILCRPWGLSLPQEFYGDWVEVADEEATHFLMLQKLLNDLGAEYGDLPAHDGLWQAAERTSLDLLARLAVVPLTLEARGLDTTPMGIEKLRSNQDHTTADALEIIYRDEIKHVASGMRWFLSLTAQQGIDPARHYRLMLDRYFPGNLKPPFNETARSQAGMPRNFYVWPLA